MTRNDNKSIHMLQALLITACLVKAAKHSKDWRHVFYGLCHASLV